MILPCQKWWSPNHRSTFIKVPEHELSMFEEEILIPFFGLHLKDYGFPDYHHDSALQNYT